MSQVKIDMGRKVYNLRGTKLTLIANCYPLWRFTHKTRVIFQTLLNVLSQEAFYTWIHDASRITTAYSFRGGYTLHWRIFIIVRWIFRTYLQDKCMMYHSISFHLKQHSTVLHYNTVECILEMDKVLPWQDWT